MNPNLKSTTYIDEVQPAVAFHPSMEALNANAGVVSGLPFGRFYGTSRRLLMAGIGVDYWLRSVLPLDVMVQGVTGISLVADHIVGNRTVFETGFLS